MGASDSAEQIRAFVPDAAYFRDPYARLAALRQHDPIHRLPDGSFMLTRYADVVSILKDTRFIRSGLAEELQKKWHLGETPPYLLACLFNDPPDHTRLRALTKSEFTPRVGAALATEIEKITHECLDALPSDEPIDLVRHLAFPIPLFVVGHLLGIPVEYRPKIMEYSAAHGAVATMATGHNHDANKTLIDYANRLRSEWADLLTDLLDRRRHDPQDDLITRLAQAMDAGKLSLTEALSTLIGLIFAGASTTTDGIGSGVYLLKTMGSWDDVLGQPELMGSAVEELLRFEPPVQVFVRFASEDIEIGGVRIAKGSKVIPMTGGANRDPSVFDDPDRFDIRRQNNRHLSFGSGIHFCQGSWLGREEIKVVLSVLSARFPRLRIVNEGDPPWRHNMTFRGLTRLDVVLGGA